MLKCTKTGGFVLDVRRFPPPLRCQKLHPSGTDRAEKQVGHYGGEHGGGEGDATSISQWSDLTCFRFIFSFVDGNRASCGASPAYYE